MNWSKPNNYRKFIFKVVSCRLSSLTLKSLCRYFNIYLKRNYHTENFFSLGCAQKCILHFSFQDKNKCVKTSTQVDFHFVGMFQKFTLFCFLSPHNLNDILRRSKNSIKKSTIFFRWVIQVNLIQLNSEIIYNNSV